MGFTLFIIFGSQIFAGIGMPVPGFYNKIQENKWMFGISAFFLGGQLS